MKQYTIDFNHDLPHVTILVSNGHHISRFSWHAQCLGHSMGLIVWGYNGRAPHAFSLCTYRPHGRTWQNAGAPNREWIKYGSECQ